MTNFERVQDMIDNDLYESEIGNLSDGCHTFKELYDFRMVYNAALFNEWAKAWRNQQEWMIKGRRYDVPEFPKYDAHKSWNHNDGSPCFGGGWFIVVAKLPTGQISNHYEEKYWHLFKIPALERARYEFDGHTSQDVLTRLKEIL